MSSFLHRIIQARPRPFIRLQKFLGIHQEWSVFKSYLRPHKFKLLFLGSLAAYPLYKPYVDYYSTTFNLKLQSQLQSDQPVPQALESFTKHLVENVLRDPQMKREGAIFVENLAKKDAVVEGIVTLLTESAKDPHFVKETLVLAKFLTHELLQDKVLEQDAVALVIKLLRDPEVKIELQEVVKWLIQQESTKKELVDLCRDGFQQPKMQLAVKELMAAALYEILMDKETVEKLKLFSYYLVGGDKSTKDGSSVKGLVNMVVDKVAKGHKVENRDSEFQRVLKGEGNEDVFESINERKKSTEQDGKEQKKFFFF